MTNQARFAITADDKTRAAFLSVQRNFDRLGREFQGTMRGINGGLNLIAGVGIAQGFRKVINATAESTAGAKSFGKALKDVKAAATDLLAAKSGLPEATKQMQELTGILKDPGIVAAVDAFTSALISGFGKFAKVAADGVGDVRQLMLMIGAAKPETKQELIDDLDRKLKEKRDELRGGGMQVGPDGLPILGLPQRTAEQTDALRAEIALLEKRQQLLIDYRNRGGASGRGGGGTAEDRERRITGLGSAIPGLQEARRQAEAAAKEARGASGGRSLREIQDSIYGDLDQETRREMEQTMDDINRDSQRGLDELHGRWEKWKDATGGTIDDLSVFGDQAARNMQDAFAEFFKTGEGNAKDFARSMIDAFRSILADRAAKELLELFSSYGKDGKRSGTGGIIGTILGGIFGGFKAAGGPVAAGTSYIVGERGPELFTPRSSGNIVPNNKLRGGGVTYSPVFNISVDSRSDRAAVQRDMLEIAQRVTVEGLRRFNDSMDRSGYPPIRFLP